MGPPGLELYHELALNGSWYYEASLHERMFGDAFLASENTSQVSTCIPPRHHSILYLLPLYMEADMQKIVDMMMDKKAVDFVAKVEDLFKSLPHLPAGIVEFFVKIAPWLALIGAVLSLLAGPILGLLSVFSLLTLNPLIVLSVLLAAVISIVTAVMLFMAFNPLKNREYKGWLLIFWSDVLSAIMMIFDVIVNRGAGLGSIVFTLIGFYILFEMKPAYSSKKGLKG